MILTGLHCIEATITDAQVSTEHRCTFPPLKLVGQKVIGHCITNCSISFRRNGETQLPTQWASTKHCFIGSYTLKARLHITSISGYVRMPLNEKAHRKD